MERDSFVFYKSFYKALKHLPIEEKAKVYDMIAEYALYGMITEMNTLGSAIFELIKPQIDANNKKFENGKKGANYGKKGGRPKKNNPKETPPEPQENPKENEQNREDKNPKETPKEPLRGLKNNPKKTPNVNVNENVNVYLKEEEIRRKLPFVFVDKMISLTGEECRRIAEEYEHSEWLKNNFLQLSKIEIFKTKILSGFYRKEKVISEKRISEIDNRVGYNKNTEPKNFTAEELNTHFANMSAEDI